MGVQLVIAVVLVGVIVGVAPALAETETFARLMASSPSPVADPLGGFAWWDPAAARFQASGFAPGSVELTPKALEAVAKLSKILNDKGVADYELMIAGHTDSIQVNRAETIKALRMKDIEVLDFEHQSTASAPR